MINQIIKYSTKIPYCPLNLSYRFTSKKITIDPNGKYYQRLQISRSATLPQIKKSYYQMIKKYHPDFAKGHEDKLKQVKEAYDVLSNSDLRKQYDDVTEPGDANKKQQRSKQEYYSGSGPYQTEQQFNQNSQKRYYNHSKLQWSQIRQGYRPQSYISLQSEMFKNKGATTDFEIFEYGRVIDSLNEKQKEQEIAKAKNAQQIAKINQRQLELRRKHQQKVKIALQKQNEMAKSNNIFTKIKNLFQAKKQK